MMMLLVLVLVVVLAAIVIISVWGCLQRVYDHTALVKACASQFESTHAANHPTGVGRTDGVLATYGPGLAPLEYACLTGLIDRKTKAEAMGTMVQGPPVAPATSNAASRGNPTRAGEVAHITDPIFGSAPAVLEPITARAGALQAAVELQAAVDQEDPSQVSHCIGLGSDSSKVAMAYAWPVIPLLLAAVFADWGCGRHCMGVYRNWRRLPESREPSQASRAASAEAS
jgi:hypothetical protein